MEEHDDVRKQNTNDELKRRFLNRGFEKQRSPRDEVIEILAEGMWTLICQGRGPSSGGRKQDESKCNFSKTAGSRERIGAVETVKLIGRDTR
jgi:hypothetical protein